MHTKSSRATRARRHNFFKLGAIAIVGTVAFLICVSAVHPGADVGTSLAALPGVGLACMMFRDAEKGGGGGGTENKIPKELPQPEANATIEQKLAHWQKAATDFFKQLSGAFSEKDTEMDAHKQTKSALQTEKDAHQKTKDALKTEQDAHKETTGKLSTANTTITGLTSERDTANKNVTRLEKLCDLRGVDHKEVVAPENGGPVASETAADWNVKLAAAKTPEAQHQVLVDFQKAVQSGKVKKAETA